MSRIGKEPVILAEGVTCAVDGQKVTVKGKLGELSYEMHEGISAKVEDGKVVVSRKDDSYKALHGLARALIHNMVVGVSAGYKKQLAIEGKPLGPGSHTEHEGKTMTGAQAIIASLAAEGVDAELALVTVQPIADGFGQRHMVAARGFEFDNQGRCMLKQGKNLVKGRDLLVRALKPELLQLVQRQILDLALDIRAALQIRVMEDGKRAVLQKMHVQLRAEAALDGPAEGREGVFGDDGLVMEAAVRVAVFFEELPFRVPLPAPQRQREQQIQRQKHDQNDADCQHGKDFFLLISWFSSTKAPLSGELSPKVTERLPQI